jgi:hypothetical protein
LALESKPVDEVAKAKAVKQQKRVCDHLLNHRILIQKSLVAANTLKTGLNEEAKMSTKRGIKAYIKEMTAFER